MNNTRAPYLVTEMFEQAICNYTGAPYCVAVDNCSNALFLAIKYFIAINNSQGQEICIPKRTYPSVPNEIIHAGGRVKFTPQEIVKGSYWLLNTNILDSALRFTANMYEGGTFTCLSFTGPHKHLKLGKAGAILTDNKEAYEWFKKARFSGRSECSYHVDDFDNNPVIGWNMYLLPEIAARGLMLMQQFYNADGSKKHNEDLELPYPDLSRFDLWK